MSDCSTNAFKVPELKPCPFCGGTTRLTHGDIIASPIAIFKCRKCGAVVSFDEPVCNAGATNNDDTPAIKAWNNRYEPSCQKVPGKMKYGTRMPKCSNCGQSLGDDRWNYCPKCGFKVVE